MSQTDGIATEAGSEVRPLVVYNCVQHREQNAVDCSIDASLEAAAQTYNAAIAVGFPEHRQQMDKFHPLNFGGAGSTDSIKMLPSKLDVLASLARAEAEARGVLVGNFERLAQEHLARAAAKSTQTAELLATLEDLNEMIRRSTTLSPWLGEAAPRS